MDHRNLTQSLMVRIAIGVFSVLSAAMILLAVFNDKGALQVRARAHQLESIESENQKIEQDIKRITDENKALSTDPAAIEKLAREELKLVKPGEVILATPDKQDKQDKPDKSDK